MSAPSYTLTGSRNPALIAKRVAQALSAQMRIPVDLESFDHVAAVVPDLPDDQNGYIDSWRALEDVLRPTGVYMAFGIDGRLTCYVRPV